MTVYRSMRGELIDIDLIKIKSKISEKDKSAGVIKRESYVKGKRKRISRKRIEEMINKTDLDAESHNTVPVEEIKDSEDEQPSENKKSSIENNKKPIKTIKRDRK